MCWTRSPATAATAITSSTTSCDAAKPRRLAARIRELDQELNRNNKALADLVELLVPGLLDERGIGPVSAAQAIVSYSHHRRCRNEVAYAMLAGAAH